MRFARKPVSLHSEPPVNETTWFMNGFVREKRVRAAPYCCWTLGSAFPCSNRPDLLRGVFIWSIIDRLWLCLTAFPSANSYVPDTNLIKAPRTDYNL